MLYNTTSTEAEQSEPEIGEIAGPEPEIQAEQAPEKDEDDRGQRSYRHHNPPGIPKPTESAARLKRDGVKSGGSGADLSKVAGKFQQRARSKLE